jgi:mono/diheme cytochrome c family protein
MRVRFAFLSATLSVLASQAPALADQAEIDRGHYLVTISGCSDCHTPGALLGTPDMKRLLGGSDVGFGIPGLGVFVGPNLTPDKETGLGGWTDAQVIAAMTTGARPDGRILSGVMPFAALSHLTPADAQAIVAYLRSLPPVRNAVPGPIGPNEKTNISVSVIIPGATYSAIQTPAK